MIETEHINVDRLLKIKYLNIGLCVILYFIFSIVLKELASENNTIKLLNIYIGSPSLRGIIIQLQMLISVYLVLRENKVGYNTAVFINIYSMFMAGIFLIRNTSIASLPGLISYVGVLYYGQKLCC